MTTQENRTRWSNVMVLIGLLFMAVTALLPLLYIYKSWMRWVFAAGALIVLVGRILGAYNGPNLRIKRLHRILISSGILYCASALMMFISYRPNDWLGFLLAGIVVQIYASWMIGREEEKTEK